MEYEEMHYKDLCDWVRYAALEPWRCALCGRPSRCRAVCLPDAPKRAGFDRLPRGRRRGVVYALIETQGFTTDTVVAVESVLVLQAPRRWNLRRATRGHRPAEELGTTGRVAG